jgi:hypothetical protein
MRIISALSVRSDGTTTVTVTDYHPARVFRGRKQEVVRRTYTTTKEIEAELGKKRGVTNAAIEAIKNLSCLEGIVPRSSWRKRP